MELDYIIIGKRLKYLRGELSQAVFGKNIGYSYGYVKNCEHGKKPSLEYLHKVVEYYGASINWILYGIEPIYSTELKTDFVPPYDSDLTKMIEILIALMNKNQEIRAWTKIQFKRIFTEYYLTNQEH